MEKVQIYNTPEEMWKQLGRKVYKNNLKTKKKFAGLCEKAMLEYKEESGFNKLFLEAQENEKPQRDQYSPAEVRLSKGKQEKFNEQYHDLGKGLEQKVLVALFTYGNKYSCGEGNNGELLNSFEDCTEYNDIASLAHDVKEELSKIKYLGIKFTPVFYTVKEEVAIVPEHISNDPEGYLREINEEAEKDNFLPTEFKELFLDGLRDFAYSKDKIRGLTEEECSEFEKLFYQQDPNTP